MFFFWKWTGGVSSILPIQLKCLIPAKHGLFNDPCLKIASDWWENWFMFEFAVLIKRPMWAVYNYYSRLLLHDTDWFVQRLLSYSRPSIDPINHPHSKVVEQYDLFLVYIHLQHAKITRVLVTHLLLLILPGPFPNFSAKMMTLCLGISWKNCSACHENRQNSRFQLMLLKALSILYIQS